MVHDLKPERWPCGKTTLVSHPYPALVVCDGEPHSGILHEPPQSKEAFTVLIDAWAGILVSDGYGVCQDWVHYRHTCLAHLIWTVRNSDFIVLVLNILFNIKSSGLESPLCYQY